MKQTPAIFERLCMTSLGFDVTSAGLAHACFDMLATSHGDGNRYEWPAADGVRKYTIQRSEREVIVDGWPINEWALKIETAESTQSLVVNCIDVKLSDDQGEPCSNEMANEVFRATLDAREERTEKDASLEYFIVPGVARIANPDYHPRLF
jgi:hypothetical protein